MSKNLIAYFVVGAIVLYIGNSYITTVEDSFKAIKGDILIMKSDITTIGQKIEIDKKASMDNYKLQLNLDTFQGTGCISCHNNVEMALPIYKRTIPEAIKIVREGTPESLRGGMPQYLSRATRDRSSIVDSELKVRLDRLYTNEFLNLVPSPPSQQGNQVQH